MKWEELSAEDLPSANGQINARLSAIADLVAPNIDPYKGIDSVPDRCRQNNLPKNYRQTAGNTVTAFASFYSSKNQVLGLCDDPSQLLKTQYLLLYCGKGNIYLIKYFYPDSEEWRREPVASC